MNFTPLIYTLVVSMLLPPPAAFAQAGPRSGAPTGSTNSAAPGSSPALPGGGFAKRVAEIQELYTGMNKNIDVMLGGGSACSKYFNKSACPSFAATSGIKAPMVMLREQSSENQKFIKSIGALAPAVKTLDAPLALSANTANVNACTGSFDSMGKELEKRRQASEEFLKEVKRMKADLDENLSQLKKGGKAFHEEVAQCASEVWSSAGDSIRRTPPGNSVFIGVFGMGQTVEVPINGHRGMVLLFKPTSDSPGACSPNTLANFHEMAGQTVGAPSRMKKLGDILDSFSTELPRLNAVFAQQAAKLAQAKATSCTPAAIAKANGTPSEAPKSTVSGEKPEAGKTADGKPADGKVSEGKTADGAGKAEDKKAADGKPEDKKVADAKPGDKADEKAAKPEAKAEVKAEAKPEAKATQTAEAPKPAAPRAETPKATAKSISATEADAVASDAEAGGKLKPKTDVPVVTNGEKNPGSAKTADAILAEASNPRSGSGSTDPKNPDYDAQAAIDRANADYARASAKSVARPAVPAADLAAEGPAVTSQRAPASAPPSSAPAAPGPEAPAPVAPAALADPPATAPPSSAPPVAAPPLTAQTPAPDLTKSGPGPGGEPAPTGSGLGAGPAPVPRDGSDAPLSPDPIPRTPAATDSGSSIGAGPLLLGVAAAGAIGTGIYFATKKKKSSGYGGDFMLPPAGSGTSTATGTATETATKTDTSTGVTTVTQSQTSTQTVTGVVIDIGTHGRTGTQTETNTSTGITTVTLTNGSTSTATRLNSSGSALYNPGLGVKPRPKSHPAARP